MVTANRHEQLFKINFSSLIIPESTDAALSLTDNNAALWHRRLAHIRRTSISRVNALVNGIDLTSNYQHEDDCKGCLEGKAVQSNFPHSTNRASELLELVHTDIAGPSPVPSFKGGHEYFITFTDDKS